MIATRSLNDRQLKCAQKTAICWKSEEFLAQKTNDEFALPVRVAKNILQKNFTKKFYKRILQNNFTKKKSQENNFRKKNLEKKNFVDSDFGGVHERKRNTSAQRRNFRAVPPAQAFSYCKYYSILHRILL